MRKAIRLKVTLQIEGEDAPAHDFGKATIQAVRDILAAGNWRHPQLAVNVKDIVEDDDYDADDGKKDAGDHKDADADKPAAPPAAAAS
jgi:hypothetical protein